MMVRSFPYVNEVINIAVKVMAMVELIMVIILAVVVEGSLLMIMVMTVR